MEAIPTVPSNGTVCSTPTLCKAVLNCALVDHFLSSHSAVLSEQIGSNLRKFLKVGFTSSTTTTFDDGPDPADDLEEHDDGYDNSDSDHEQPCPEQDDILPQDGPEDGWNRIAPLVSAIKPSAGGGHADSYFKPVADIKHTPSQYSVSLSKFIVSILNCSQELTTHQIKVFFKTTEEQLFYQQNKPSLQAISSYYSPAVTSSAKTLWSLCSTVTSTQLDELKNRNNSSVQTETLRKSLVDAVHSFCKVAYSERCTAVSGAGLELSLIKFLSLCYCKEYSKSGKHLA